MTGATDTITVVRRVLLGIFIAVFLGSIIIKGIPVDRIAVLLWMLAAFMVSSVGRGKDDISLMVRDWFIIVLIYMAYDYSRGTADQWGIGVNYTLPRDLDRLLFFGNDPVLWMQKHLYIPDDVRWYDVGGAIIYMCHFVLPVVPLTTLRVRNRLEWIHYVRRFATTLTIAVTTFIVFPAAPPWMVSDHGKMGVVHRITGRGWWELNLKTVSRTIDRGAAVLNAVAAMPSLHAGMSLLVALWFARHAPRWVRIAALLYPLSMMATLVYFGEHFVSDCLMGFAATSVAWVASTKWEKRKEALAPQTLN
jgi:hypothetical protein